MRFSLIPVFSYSMLPSLQQGNSHNVLPLRGLLWRLPHTFSAGISWWLRKHTPAFLQVLPPLPGRFRLAVPAFPLPLFLGGGKLFECSCFWLSGFLPFAPHLMLGGFLALLIPRLFKFL